MGEQWQGGGPVLTLLLTEWGRGAKGVTITRRKTLDSAVMTTRVTDLQGPPSEHTQTEKLRDLKKLAQHYARDQGSCDDTRISYLEFLESEADNDLTLARMIAG
jgi:hypothetical protein